MPKRSRSASICDGLRNTCFVHMGRGFLPLLAVMFLAAPQLAFAQGSLAVTVNPRTLEIDEGEFGTYTIVLDTAPSEDVKITVVGAPTADADVTVGAPGADTTDGTLVLTFTADSAPDADDGTWDDPQTVTVTTLEDADAVSETMTLTHTATIGDDDDAVAMVVARGSVRVTVKDGDTRSVTLSETSLTFMEAEETGSYTVVLGTEPTGTVTVDIGGASGEITVSPSRLFFTAENYEMAQTVTVFAGEDFDAETDEATLTHTVRGGDYTGVAVSPTPGTVSVMVTDNDVRGVSVSTGSLSIAAGANATYTVMLDARPTRSVAITVAEDTDLEGVTVSPTRLSFSTTDWNRPKTVTVRTNSEASGSVNMTHTVDDSSSSRDKAYDGVTIAPVSVTVSGTQPGVRLSPSSLTINEGATRTYTVRLAADPTTNMTVAVASPNSDVMADPDSLEFTTDNWNDAQTVTVSVAEDDDAVSDTAMLTHRHNSDSGPNLANGMLRVTVSENDRRGVSVAPTSLEVVEGATGNYSISLNSQPVGDDDGNVTVTISGASGDVTVDPSQLRFTATTWRSEQTVEVRVAHDSDGEPDDAVTLSHTVRGGDYDRESVDNVRVTIREDETRGIITNTDSLPLTEGKTGEYMVSLEAQPTGTVTVMVRGATGDVTVKPSRLVFTTSNWNEPQSVEVKAGQDADGEPDEAVILDHAASGGGYNGVTGGTVTVTITDNDPKRVIVTPSRLTVMEGSAARSYSVVLTTEPTGSVTVSLVGLAAAKDESLVVNPTTLTFTQRNWSIPQDVTVRAAEDDNAAGGSVTLVHELNGGGYGDVPASNVIVAITDNDMAGLTVKPAKLEIAQGTSRTYTVVLNTKPDDDVTVTISGGPTGTTASPGSLIFTPNNWFTARTVRVHAAADATVGMGNVANTVSSSSSDYGADQSADVVVDVLDADAPGVAVNPTSLSIKEGGSDSYTMVLTKAPTASVYVDISGASGDVRVSRSRVSFSTTNWNREQSVTVSVSEDDDAVQDVPVTLTHKVSGADEYEDMDPDTDGVQSLMVTPVLVTLSDNDTIGVTVAPTSLTIGAGGTGTYRIRLNTKPTDAVQIRVNSPRDDVTVSGSPLTFTTATWNSEQTVTVMVDKEAGSEEVQSVTLTHSVSGADYAGVEPSPVTVTIPVEGTPGAPGGLTATAGNQQVTLRWRAPASDGGSAIARYEYRSQESGSGFTAWTTIPGGASATSYTVTGLENGISYTFEVRAVNSIGGGRGSTTSATLAESVPGAPANLTATGGDEQVALSWNAPADGGSQILRYEYRYGAVGESYGAWATVSGGPNATSLTVTGLTNGREYGFQVRAVNSIGEGAAAEDSATPGRVPTAPTGLTARVESETITVMWGMPTDTGGSSVTGYQVRYRMNGGGWSNWMTVAGGANATSYTMTGLTNGIGHEIEVRAVNAIGRGAAASVEATPMEGIDFAHFANGQSTGVTITSDIVLVNVETSTVTPAIYFYNQMGEMIPADSVVDLMGGLEMAGDGSLAVPMGIAGRGEMTISTNGEGALVIGSVRVFGSGRLGGVLRFDIPFVGVAGVGASEPVNDAIFPARRMVGGINTGAAIRNLSSEPMTVTCMLMQGGDVMDTKMVRLAGDGHSSEFIHEMFPGSNTTDFVGSVRCTAADGGMFAGVALELDAPNGIFTTLPVVPLNTGSDSGESMLNFAHFANGDFAGTATSSDLVFVNVATSAVSPAIYFYDQMGNMIDASMVVDAMMEGVEVDSDGALMVMDGIPPMGEMTISTSGMGDGMIGSVRVVSDGPIGGVLRFDIPNFGVAGVGASEAVNAAIFPARRMADGINTGAAIRNLMAEMTTVTCRLMKGGNPMGENPIELPGNGQNSEFINELFPNANTDDFEGSVHCTAPAGSMFTGVALEMDFNNRIFTTLPVVPVR